MAETTDNPTPEKSESSLPEAVVLVVSPDDRLLHWMDVCWADFRLHLLKASSPEEAEELVCAGDPDLILIHADPCPDLAFPVCLTLRQSSSQASIYLVREAYEIQDHLQCLRLGCDGILTFPPNPSQIAQIITGIAVRRKNEEPLVLWVDDDVSLMKVYTAILRKAGIQMLTSDQPMLIFDLLPAHSPDILLLDYEMPNVNGAELCRMIRLRPEYRTLPILILTASTDPEVRRKCLESGADDYIRKPIDTVDLLARLQAKVIRGDMLKSLATQDPLTLLNTHQAFLDALSRECSRAMRYSTTFALVVLDVDAFADVNRQYSFTVGDEVLRRIASTLRDRFRRSDVMGRIGSNRFTLLLHEIDRETAVAVIAEFLQSMSPITYNGLTPGTQFRVSLRAGIARYPADGNNPRTLLGNAIHALQAAKSAPARVSAYAPPRR